MQVVLAQRMHIPFQAPSINSVPRFAQPQSVALHVLYGSRRLSDCQFFARILARVEDG